MLIKAMLQKRGVLTPYTLATQTGFATELALAIYSTSEMFQISLTALQSHFVSAHTNPRQARWSRIENDGQNVTLSFEYESLSFLCRAYFR